MASRRIEDLHPDLQSIYYSFKKEAEVHGLDFIVTCTYRTNEEQNREYARGRTISSGIDVNTDRPLGRTVTRAKGGQSAHNSTLPDGAPASKAFDIVPIFNGKPQWSEKHPAWQSLGKIGMDLGLNWYGRPGAPFKEFPHFQLK